MEGSGGEWRGVEGSGGEQRGVEGSGRESIAQGLSSLLNEALRAFSVQAF